MAFADKWLVCVDCGREFLWDAGEQSWFFRKRLSNQPRRCKSCRQRRRDDRLDGDARQDRNQPPDPRRTSVGKTESDQ